jgi:hypothetical protein
MLGDPAPVRRFLPDLMDLVLRREINPGKVFDLELPWRMSRKAIEQWMNGRQLRRFYTSDAANWKRGRPPTLIRRAIIHLDQGSHRCRQRPLSGGGDETLNG